VTAEHDAGCGGWRKSSHSGSSGGECVEVSWLGTGHTLHTFSSPEEDAAVSR
jgi:hypothetical protein